MNGFAMMVDSYRNCMNEGEIDRETAEKEIRIYEFLATCDTDDFCRMIDSSAFNDIIKAFLKMAVTNAEIDEDSKDKVLSQLRWILDEKQAKDVLELNCCISINSYFQKKRNTVTTYERRYGVNDDSPAEGYLGG